MALIKREYTDQETVITGKNLNDIQDAVIALEDGLFSLDNDKSGEVITMTDAANRGFRVFKIFGKTTQDGTPTPDAPVDLVSVGDSGSITVNVAGEKDAQSMTIATPNGLPGIPVTSGGNYTDANGQQWICDEIDLARGVYVQRVAKKVFDGTENWETPSDANVFGYKGLSAIRQPQYCLCSHSSNNSMVGTGYMQDKSYTLRVQGYIYCKDTDISTVEDWKSMLAEQYAAGTPITIQYILETPIETPLSAEEVAAFSSLRTYKDLTTVSNDASAYMELEYAMDAKKYIDGIVISGGGGGAVARLGGVTLLASAWTGADSLYSQVVTIDGVTKYNKVDLLPSVEQLAIFHDKDVAFVTENEDGVVTVYAIGDKPTQDYTMQVSITEVVA